MEIGRRLDPGREWKHAAPKAKPSWPKVAPTWQVKRLPCLSDRLWDGVGWKALEVNVTVIPTDPGYPVNAEVINVIDMTQEMIHWFWDVADKRL